MGSHPQPHFTFRFIFLHFIYIVTYCFFICCTYCLHIVYLHIVYLFIYLLGYLEDIVQLEGVLALSWPGYKLGGHPETPSECDISTKLKPIGLKSYYWSKPEFVSHETPQEKRVQPSCELVLYCLPLGMFFLFLEWTCVPAVPCWDHTGKLQNIWKPISFWLLTFAVPCEEMSPASAQWQLWHYAVH